MTRATRTPAHGVTLSDAAWVWGYVGLATYVGWVSGLLFGLRAAVVAILSQALIRVGKRTLRGPPLMAVVAVSFIATAFLHVVFPVAISVVAALLVLRFKVGTLKVLGICAVLGAVVVLAGLR